MERKYSLSEIDEMRVLVRARGRSGAFSRSQAEWDSLYEDELRTLMMNGTTVEELRTERAELDRIQEEKWRAEEQNRIRAREIAPACPTCGEEIAQISSNERWAQVRFKCGGECWVPYETSTENPDRVADGATCGKKKSLAINPWGWTGRKV